MRRAARRAAARAAEPVDYSGDYQLARRDLVRIAILSSLLFIAMVILRVTGVL
ncbi:MAG TPA: hypothetical protein PKA05_05220 [Roseiflexaceae bacterium]|nr:hypothetical protein [Roseiflexaceae bacterium]